MEKLIKTYNISFMYNFFVDLRKRGGQSYGSCVQYQLYFCSIKICLNQIGGHRAYRGVQKSLITF